MMSKGIANEHTLSRNSINKFILRIDLCLPDGLRASDIANKMSTHFDRVEKKKISKIEIKYTEDTSSVTNESNFDYVLISEANGISMTFSDAGGMFVLESNTYKDNSVYKDPIRKTIQAIKSIATNIESKRIGLRYINEFRCQKSKDISSIYGKRLATTTKHMLDSESQTRVIGMEEYNYDDHKIRFHYGVFNNYYPSLISVYDLLMDIDSFVESVNKIDDWETVISSLNHAAYNKFITEINPQYLEKLK